MVYTQDNLILFLANGAKLINGSNENHKKHEWRAFKIKRTTWKSLSWKQKIFEG